MVSYSENDPLFLRLKRAWLAYEDLQAKRGGVSMPYKTVMLDDRDPALQTAAVELAQARDAWLADPRHDDIRPG